MNKGIIKINKEFNIVKIVRSLRHMKILLKNSLINEQIQFEIYHYQKNIINIDESQDDDKKHI